MMLLVALMLAAPPAEPVPPALHGVWRVTAEVMEGVPTPEECYRDLRFEIDANTLRLRDGDNVLECKAATDPRLRILVLTPRTGSRLDRPFVGLYFISGDLMRICLPRESRLEPPDQDSAPAGSNRVLISLRREK